VFGAALFGSLSLLAGEKSRQKPDQPPQQSAESNERGQEPKEAATQPGMGFHKPIGCRKFWEDAKDLWFEGREHLSPAEKRKLFENLAPDRKLTPKQKDIILRMWDRLVDKKPPCPGCRADIPGWLGDMGHAYCIPPLLAVLRDKTEDGDLRVECAIALGHIADKRVIDPLIDAMGEEGILRHEALASIAGLLFQANPDIEPPTLDREPSSLVEGKDALVKWRMQTQAKYRAWWKQNRDRMKLSRAASFATE
jgi:hypothetical protein